jgi:hypothetical protein
MPTGTVCSMRWGATAELRKQAMSQGNVEAVRDAFDRFELFGRSGLLRSALEMCGVLEVRRPGLRRVHPELHARLEP